MSAFVINFRSMHELANVRTVEELLALQSRLAGIQFERGMEFWSELWRAAGDSQRALIGEAQSQFGQLHQGLREAAQDAAQQRAA